MNKLLPLIFAVLAGCATNSQRVDSRGVRLDGAPSGMNSLAVQGDEYRIVSRNPIGVVDGQGFSMSGENPINALQLNLGDGRVLNIGSSSDGVLDSVVIEDLVVGVKTSLGGFTWTNSKVNESTAQIGIALYTAMRDLSKDEAAVRLKQLEVAGDVAGEALGVARLLLGVP